MSVNCSIRLGVSYSVKLGMEIFTFSRISLINTWDLEFLGCMYILVSTSEIWEYKEEQFSIIGIVEYVVWSTFYLLKFKKSCAHMASFFT
jgi:hypothetical protein